jgi:hypothetical protein
MVEQEAFFHSVRSKLRHEAVNRHWTKTQFIVGETPIEVGEVICTVLFVLLVIFAGIPLIFG